MDNLIFLTLDILLHSSVIHVHVVVAILYGADPAVPFARRTASLTEHEASCAGTTGCHARQQSTEDKQPVVGHEGGRATAADHQNQRHVPRHLAAQAENTHTRAHVGDTRSR